MKDAVATANIVRFGTFEVDLRAGELRKSGLKLKLTGQPFQVLTILLEHPGNLVTREELQKRLWPDTFVDVDGNLNTAINKIREVLGDSAETPRFVETLPRRGYRFIGEVARQTPVVDKPSDREDDRKDVRWRWRRIALWTVATGVCALVAAFSYPRLRPPAVANLPAPVPFTAFPGMEVAPTFSPDGAQIAFAWNGDPASGSKGFDLYVKVIGSENLLRLTNRPSESISPAWSPDGSEIAFHRVAGADTGLYVVPALGGAERKLRSTHVAAASVSAISWSPDKKWIAFADSPHPGGYLRLYLLSLETLQSTQIPHTEECQGELSPAFSPDGRQLAYACNLDTGGFALYSIAPPSGEPELIKKFTGATWGMAWAGDGKGLILAHLLNFESRGIDVLNLADGSLRKLPFGESGRWPATTMKGDKLAYDTRGSNSNVNIWRRDLLHPHSAAIKLIASTRLEICPRYSPDGKHIAFASSRGGTLEIWISDADGTHLLQLSNLGNRVTGTPSWSPDSKKIVFDTRYSDHADLYIVDISERLPRKLITNIADAAVPSWSHDGKWIYFLGNAGKELGRIYRCSPEGGDAVALSSQPGYAPQESLDGETIYFSSNWSGNTVLKMASTKQLGKESLLEGMPPISFGAHWTISPGGVYFQPAEALKSIRYFEFATKKVRQVFEIDKELYVGLSVSPDARWLLYSQLDDAGSDIMLVDHFR